MKLDEAKVILEENGYELLEEGKLGRVLAAGALALGSLFGFANANYKTDIANFNKVEKLEKIDCDNVYINKKAGEYVGDIENYTCYEGDGKEFLIRNNTKKYGYKECIVTDVNSGNVEHNVSIWEDQSIHSEYKDNKLHSIYVKHKNGTFEAAFINDDEENEIMYEKLDKNGNGVLYGIKSDNDLSEHLLHLDFDKIENEHIMWEVKLKNGEFNGKMYWYRDNGSLMREENWVNGKQDGLTVGYFDDGTEAFRVNYKNGKQVGHMVCSDGRKGRDLTCYHPKKSNF